MTDDIVDGAKPWHAMSGADALRLMDTRPDGLDDAEVKRRQLQYGPNRLADRKAKGPLLRFFLQFHNVLIYVMLAGAVVTASLEHWVDAGVLFGAVFINAVIGFIQEGRAESALDAIRQMLSPHAMVIRDGHRCEIDAALLVPGDIVALTSGDRVPADVRLISVRELRVEEAALTGESSPVEKHADPVAPDATVGDRFCMAYSGTLVVYGQATGVVVATAGATEIGKINQMLSEIQSVSTPLLRQIDAFARRLAVAILIMAAVTFVIGVLWRGHSPQDMFLMVIALAAAAIPEGLPAIITVTLALGVQRMARRKAIVRRLPAVEALGSVTVICSDKTGTLTKNEMTVQRVVCTEGSFDVTGSGYEPEGEFLYAGNAVRVEAHPALQVALRAGMLCNDGGLVHDQGHWRVEGDPTEGALLVSAAKAKMDRASVQSQWPRIDAIPFESQHRFMATLHRGPDGAAWIFVKGAPEQLLEMCDTQLGPLGVQPLDHGHWRQASNELAAQGLRLLGIAVRQLSDDIRQLTMADMKQGFTFVALAGIVDPPRPEAMDAVLQCQRAGIRVKMITGDHIETARAIGERLSIGLQKPALSGTDIALMDDQALRRAAGDADVFARASPEHKLRLVQALQASNHVVAMTGDGVNDAPALKQADVGIAMGMKGTEAAKEAGDMVLADDNFATIASAVRQGRAVYDNIKKSVLFMLPTNGGEVLVVIAAILFELTLPLTAAQVLWINMATSVTLCLALAFEPVEHGIMGRPPRPAKERLLSGFFIWRVAMVSVLMMAGALTLFLWELERGASLETARTMAVNAVVAAEIFYLINSRSIFGSVMNLQGIFGNRVALMAIAACIALQFAYTHLPIMQLIFQSTDLSLDQWLRVAAAGLMVFVVAELEKAVMRWRLAVPA